MHNGVVAVTFPRLADDENRDEVERRCAALNAADDPKWACVPRRCDACFGSGLVVSWESTQEPNACKCEVCDGSGVILE